jgi:hypothetical protein
VAPGVREIIAAACAKIPRFRVPNIGTPSIIRVFDGG